jgi:gliding motility-associated-like protein
MAPAVSIINPSVVCSPATVDLTDAAVTAGSTSGLTLSYWTDAAATIVYSNEKTATAGTYYIKGTTADGCYDIQQVKVTVNQTPTVTVTPDNQSVCNNAPTTAVKFTGNTASGVTYSWTNINTTIGLSASGTGDIASFAAINNGTSAETATITVIPATANCTGAPVTFTITVNPLPTIIVNNATICSGEKATLTASGANTYNWAPSTGLSSTSGTSVTASPATTTIYTVTGTVTLTGCRNTATATVTVNQLPTIGDVQTPTVCEGDDVVLNVFPDSPTATVTWDNIPGNPTGTTVTVTPPYTGNGAGYQSIYNYSITVKDGCEDKFLIPVKVDQALNGAIETSKAAVCEDATITINADSYKAELYKWTSTSFDGEKYGATITDVLKKNTVYTLEISRGICTATDAIEIKVSSRPVILSIDSVAARDREIVLDINYGTPPFTYGVDKEQADYNSVKYNLAFSNHKFYVIDAAGCRSEALTHTVLAPQIVIPPYFSPNGDGINDTWEITNIKDIYPNAVITIYDRFGKVLVKYNGSEEGWDGKYLGREMPTTDYWYVIDIKEINKQYTGHFTLVRR